ncbi:hypothetical protein AB0J38_16985 [Streptomyces sp. NPDC050095]|uniref:hypothetical protein n=1 Tax=unclassified Streptomyces TaxID=2593676 RepID=UPI00343F83F6
MPIRHHTSLALTMAVAGTLLLAATGCSKDVPALKFGAAKPSGAKLAARSPANGSLPLAEWPNACTVLSDQEIEAVLPQAKDVKRQPIKVTILNFDPLSEAEPGTTGDVPTGGCKFTFGLPDKYESDGNSNIQVTFTAVADTPLVRKHYEEDLADARKDAPKYKKEFRDLGTSLGPAGCHSPDLSQGDLVCYQGPYQFEVSGSSTASGVGEYPKADRNWSDKVLRQIVRTLSARMN